ncbi:MAG: hypothetical protein IKC95_05325 [Oscillospiraceae bacterium]|nr:hypothetical protein [Oscillospiraceae bacterium]
MNKPIDRIPSLAEYLALWEQKDELTKDVENLQIEQVGLQASVDYLRHAEHSLRVSIANLCYDMSNIFKIAGTLADTEKTGTWHNLPKP